MSPRRAFGFVVCLENAGNEGGAGWPARAGTTARTSVDLEGVVLSCPELGHQSTTPGELRDVRALVPGLIADGQILGHMTRHSPTSASSTPGSPSGDLDQDDRVDHERDRKPDGPAVQVAFYQRPAAERPGAGPDPEGPGQAGVLA